MRSTQTVTHYDPVNEDRVALADPLARERGMTLVPPFDDPRVIAGHTSAETASNLDSDLMRLAAGGSDC